MVNRISIRLQVRISEYLNNSTIPDPLRMAIIWVRISRVRYRSSDRLLLGKVRIVLNRIIIRRSSSQFRFPDRRQWVY